MPAQVNIVIDNLHIIFNPRNTLFQLPMMIIILLLGLQLLSHHTTVVGGFGTNPTVPFQPTSFERRECTSIDVRNELTTFEQIYGCTVIKGYLFIGLIYKRWLNDNESGGSENYYKNYTFPELREITEFLIFYHVEGLTSIKKMFPNLTVIRGRKLLVNYALGVTWMPDLEALEFNSLIAIQRGHVIIDKCEKLCHLQTVNWDRLTLSPGENHIYPLAENCSSTPMPCAGCESDYCWSPKTCQKFENDNVVNLVQGSPHNCHPECLGGCYNSTNAGCVVCRGITDHGVCVSECPPDKFYHALHHRCYTRSECVSNLQRVVHNSSCLRNCPQGFVKQRENSTCAPCEPNKCKRTCVLTYKATIYNLADADEFADCQIINGSLTLEIRNKIDERSLEASFGNFQEIYGYLKIYRSPHLKSLYFLKNLQKITGDPRDENQVHSLIIYDNKNLKKLWQPKNLHLERGGLYIHLNNKLCNRYVNEFRERVVHDNSLDSLQINDQEVLCDPMKMRLHIEVISHNTIQLTWREEQTSDEVEILYRHVPHGEKFTEESELDSNVCTRINWNRQLIFNGDLITNGTHHMFNITGLTQNTQYACMLKTFSNDDYSARSPVQIVTTYPDLPTSPRLETIRKTPNSISLQLSPRNKSVEVVTRYVIEFFKHYDKEELLDNRNYCEYPAVSFRDNDITADNAFFEDYDNYCPLMEEEIENEKFMDEMNAMFACTLDTPQNCANNFINLPKLNRRVLPANQSTFTITGLQHFTLYIFQIYACSDIGCGAYSMHSDHTNYSSAADNVTEVTACRINSTNGYQEYHLYFKEPTSPNGVITMYGIHLQKYLPDLHAYDKHVICFSRREHAAANYHLAFKLNVTYEEIAVRSHSLGTSFLTKWIKLENNCDIFTPGAFSGGLGIFFVFFLIGAGGTICWVFFKRRLWERFDEIHHRYWNLTNQRDDLLLAEIDSHATFDTVRFQNTPDADQQ